MSVSGELLCSFELLKPLDSSALKSHIKKSRNKRTAMLNSPVSDLFALIPYEHVLTYLLSLRVTFHKATKDKKLSWVTEHHTLMIQK